MKSERKSFVAFFDFDGTITSRDSFVDFMRYAKGDLKFFFGFFSLLPKVFLYFSKKISGREMKEAALLHFFGGMNVTDFDRFGKEYAEKRLPRIIRKESIDKINWHKKNGHQIVIVSASLEAWLEPWCKKNGVELIATRIEESNGELTGKIRGENCVGEEKVRRIMEKYDLKKYDWVYAYGNSRDDLAMLSLANEKYFNWEKK